MCRNIAFFLSISSKKKEEFIKRFKVNYLTLDILLAVIQIFEFALYGFDGIIFIVTACMFALDAILLIWLISFKRQQEHAPKWVLIINLVSNALTVTAYSVGRIFIVFGLKAAKSAKLYQRITAATFFVLFFPMKFIKLYIMYRYKQFCKGGSTESNDEKNEQLLT